MSLEKKSRLGRGLEALLGGDEVPAAAVAAAQVAGRAEVEVGQIEANPYQPRKTFDDEEIGSLGESIKAHGILQPLVVRQVGERFQLIAGERRLRAAQLVGLPQVPVTVVNFNDQQTLEAALVENVQRSDLNPIEKAQGFKDYLDRYQMTHDQLGARLGLGRATITNLVSLLELPSELQAMVLRGELSQGHAKILKGIADPALQVRAGKEFVTQGLSVRAAEAYVKQLLAGGGANENEGGEAGGGSDDGRSTPKKTAHVQNIEDELKRKLGLKVEIKVKGKDKGQVLLSFDTNDDFERVVEALRK